MLRTSWVKFGIWDLSLFNFTLKWLPTLLRQMHPKSKLRCTKREKKRLGEFGVWRSAKHSDFDSTIVLIPSLLTKSIHWFWKISDGNVKTGFQLTLFWPFWNSCTQKDNLRPLKNVLISLVAYLRKFNLCLSFKFQLLRQNHFNSVQTPIWTWLSGCF